MPCTRTRAAAHPIRVVLRLTLPLVVGFTLAAQPVDPLTDVFARMDKIAQAFKAVTGDIKRDVYTAIIDDHQKDMGTMKAKRDRSQDTRMLIEFTSPDSRLIALDGTSAKIYTPKLKTEQDFDISKGLVDQFLLLGFGASSADLKEHYDTSFIGTEKLGSETTWHLLLIPKSKEVLKNLKKAELWISQTSGLPVQEKLFTSSTGDFELITYSNVKLNPSLADSSLKLKVPNGVTVEHPRL
jgi:outer membrane lipoprotein-sorting protein